MFSEVGGKKARVTLPLSGVSHLRRPDTPRRGCHAKAEIGQAYEWFLELPVPVVLTVLWLAGWVLEGSCVLVLYLYGPALVRMLT